MATTQQDIIDLCHFCFFGEIDAVRDLLKAGVNPNPPKELLGRDPKTGREQVNSPMLEALRGHNKEIVNLLEQHGCDVHEENDLGLRWAIDGGNIEMTRFLIEEKGCNVNSKDNDGEGAPLRIAVRTDGRNKETTFIDYLLSAGADPKLGDYPAIDFAFYHLPGTEHIIPTLLTHYDIKTLKQKKIELQEKEDMVYFVDNEIKRRLNLSIEKFKKEEIQEIEF
jgi:Ankyrin repeats (3 copies)